MTKRTLKAPPVPSCGVVIGVVDCREVACNLEPGHDGGHRFMVMGTPSRRGAEWFRRWFAEQRK